MNLTPLIKLVKFLPAHSFTIPMNGAVFRSFLYWVGWISRSYLVRIKWMSYFEFDLSSELDLEFRPGSKAHPQLLRISWEFPGQVPPTHHAEVAFGRSACLPARWPKGQQLRPGRANILHVGSLEYLHCSPSGRDVFFYDFLHLNNINK